MQPRRGMEPAMNDAMKPAPEPAPPTPTPAPVRASTGPARHRVRTALVTLAVVALAVVALRAWTRPRPLEVETTVVTGGVVEDVVTNSEGGTVRSRAQARVGSDLYGRVAQMMRREGQTVAGGEPILALDASTAQRQLDAARRDLDASVAQGAVARAADRLARRNLARAESLAAHRVLAIEELDNARSRAESSGAELRAADARRAGARAAVRVAEENIAHHVVHAPFAGVLAHRYVEVGEPVIPGQPLVEVVSLERLYVSAPIDERDAARLANGQPARITLDAYPGRVWPGVVTRLAPVVETAKEQNRTLELEVDLTPRAGLPTPRPGMTADVEVILDRRADVLRVPTSAISEGHRVLVAERGRAVSRAIEVGIGNWQWTEVRSGLASGERVITSLDRPGLKAGSPVRAKSATAPPGAAGTAAAAERR